MISAKQCNRECMRLLLTTLIIDYKAVLWTWIKWCCYLLLSPRPYNWQPPAKTFVCFNLQFTHFNIFNTVAVRNVDYIGRATDRFWPCHYIVMHSFWSIVPLTRRKYLLWQILHQWKDADSLRAIGQPSKHFSNVLISTRGWPLHCLKAMAMVWETSVHDNMKIKIV